MFLTVSARCTQADWPTWDVLTEMDRLPMFLEAYLDIRGECIVRAETLHARVWLASSIVWLLPSGSADCSTRSNTPHGVARVFGPPSVSLPTELRTNCSFPRFRE